MHVRTRWTGFLALAAVAALTIACSGQSAGEPADGATAATSPANAAATKAPAATTTAEPEAAPEPAEPDVPAPPALEGNILTSGEDFQYIKVTDTNSPATYYWTVKVTNDTTQTLDITVRFDFLDQVDGIVKTHRKTVRVSPAGETTIREESSLPYEDANKVVGFQSVVANWKIVETS